MVLDLMRHAELDDNPGVDRIPQSVEERILEVWRQLSGTPLRYVSEFKLHILTVQLANELANVVLIPAGSPKRSTDFECAEGHLSFAHASRLRAAA